jgi:hypothetical protein
MATIIKRIPLNRPLTNAEGDANFVNLNTEKIERDGSIPMTDSLKTPGVTSSSNVDGLKVYNQNNDLVATFGASNSKNLVVEGSVNIGGSSDLNMGGGDITARNIRLSGAIISSQFGTQYGISGDGEVFNGTAGNIAGKTVITIDIVLKLVTITGVFSVGNQIVGGTSGATGVITKVVGNDLYITPSDPEDSFELGETITYASNSGILSNVIDSSSFEVNQKIKIFGASLIGSSEPEATPSPSAAKSGEGTGFTYYYWVAQYRFSDGSIAAVNAVTGGVVHGEISDFNETNNIVLTLARHSTEYGILIYRSIENNLSTTKLVAILGPGELKGITQGIVYVDRGTYSNTEWSTKDINGFYTEASNIIHFPLIGSSITLKGWAFGTVESITENISNEIILTSEYEFNDGNAINFVHDSTQGIQNFIDDQREAGIQSAVFPNGTYYTSKIKVPSNFEIAGSGKQTVFKQIHWNYDYWEDAAYANQKGNIFTALESVPENITFRDLSVDGNFLNNSRYSEEFSSNYLINIPDAENINIINTRVVNSVGGGAYLYRTLYLRVQNSEFLNGGGVSYVGDNLCPIYAGQAEYLTVTNNLFENFLSPVDVSVTQIGTVVGNTIKNCGSGLLVYASAHFLSSPNLIMGPDREFIPGPDTMDSDYSSINISLQSGVDYESPAMLYIERGVPVYLGSVDKKDSSNVPIPGTAVELTSEIKMLTKLFNQETLTVDYTNAANGQPFITFISPNEGDYGRNSGNVQFKILGSQISQIPTLSTLIKDNSDGLITNHRVTINDVPIAVINEEVNVGGGYSILATSFTDGIRVMVVNEQIMGLAYSIFGTRYTYADVGERILIDSSLFDFESAEGKVVTLELSDKNYFKQFAIHDVVKVFSHSSNPDISGAECTVISKFQDESEILSTITLRLPESFPIPTSVVNGGATGYITIRKTFIIAKGRIV